VQVTLLDLLSLIYGVSKFQFFNDAITLKSQKQWKSDELLLNVVSMWPWPLTSTS